MISSGNNRYIGARYVPIIDGEWDALKDYESLTVVLFQGSSYTSKTNVPRGVQPVVGETSIYWALTGNYNAQVQEYKEQIDTTTVDQNKKINNLTTKIGVSYSDFGAVLDGITDDTNAIRSAHAYANANGLSVIQKDSIFLLNGEIEVRTNVDLSGSTCITTLQDTVLGQTRFNSTLYKIMGEELTEITGSVNKLEFIKNATTLPSLMNMPSGTLIIKTTERDLFRKDGETITASVKQESNMILKNIYGDIVYPLTKDYSLSTGFQVFLRKDDTKLTFKMPKLILNGSLIYSFIKCYRNNVEITNGVIEEKNTSATIAPMYTIADFTDCSKVSISNINCPVIGRNSKTGEDGLGYLFLFSTVCDIKIDSVYQDYGWSGINGNYFRDVQVKNCKVTTIGGHANCYDIKISNCLIYRTVTAQGGGLLEVDGCVFDGRYSPIAVQTRIDYGGEWDGIIKIKNTRTIYSTTLCALAKINYDCGREIMLPTVEIENCRMANIENLGTIGIQWFGSDSYPSSLPSFHVNNLVIENNVGPVKHKTILMPTTISTNTGQINIKIENCKVPIDSFRTKYMFSSYANISLPKITNDIIVNLEVVNSTANIEFNGTSNIVSKINNCNVYILNCVDSNSITTNGKAIVMEFSQCNIFKPNCNLNTFATKNRVLFEVINCKYYKYFTDTAVGWVFGESIILAKNNVCEVDATLFNATKLFNYIDTSIWKES